MKRTEALGTLVAAMEKGGFRPHLLYGITGSGKTAVYVAAMQRALAAGKSALLLVPEIGSTPGIAAQMVAAFAGEVALLHSQLTPDERAEQWHRIRRGEADRVVVGNTLRSLCADAGSWADPRRRRARRQLQAR